MLVYSWACPQTDAHKLGPVQDKISQLEEEKRQVIRDREETEALNRVEIDRLRASEAAIQEDTQLIKRWWQEPFYCSLLVDVTVCCMRVVDRRVVLGGGWWGGGEIGVELWRC